MALKDQLEARRSFIQMAGEWMTRPEFKDAFTKAIALIKHAIAEQDARINARLAQLKDGYTPVKGRDYFDGKPGKDGKTPIAGIDFPIPIDGADADENAIAKIVAETVTPAISESIITTIEKDLPALGQAIRDGLELLPKGERVRAEFIDGLDELLAAHTKASFVGYGPGGGTSFAIMQSGVQKVQQPLTLNFKGAGAPTITNGQNGVTHLDFSASAIAGTQEKSTTTPDGVLSTFAFAHTPRVIVWNGAIQTLTDDYTVSSLTITFTASAGTPQTGDKLLNIYA